MKNKNGPHKNLNLNVRGLGKSATIAISEKANSLMEHGVKVFKLGLGQSPFPVPEPVVEELRNNAHQKDYLQTQGLLALRKAIAHHHNQMYGLKSTAADVLIGPGSKELMFLLQLCYYGDLVIPTPAWVSYEPQAKIIGRPVNFMPTTFEDGWKIHSDHIREICHSDCTRPRIIVLNYPNNPSGTTYSNDELHAIAREAKRYEVILLSDEIYGQIHFQGKHISIATYYPEGTIISTGLSKWCGAGGWRLGCFVFPHSLKWLLDSMTAVASETYTSTSTPIQFAAVRAFQGGYTIEQYLAHVRRILSALGKKAAQMLRQAGARVAEPEGAFYLFPNFSPLNEKLARHNIYNSRDLCEYSLNEMSIAFLPGSEFGRPADELTARIAYVDFNGARALSASEHIPLAETLGDDFLDHFCRPALTGIERLCDWLTGL
ncbi:MAG: pyridoxal phosphate-dependent aminotransferase [bacterium]